MLKAQRDGGCAFFGVFLFVPCAVACFCCLPGEKVQNLLPALWSFLFLPYFCKNQFLNRYTP